MAGASRGSHSPGASRLPALRRGGEQGTEGKAGPGRGGIHSKAGQGNTRGQRDTHGPAKRGRETHGKAKQSGGGRRQGKPCGGAEGKG